ncbi:MAG: hypothetical protein MZV64_25985 [Ignavibacteriales bacterium]|nr:hypothetical protein [Ignavibacteriales bacterium]
MGLTRRRTAGAAPRLAGLVPRHAGSRWPRSPTGRTSSCRSETDRIRGCSAGRSARSSIAGVGSRGRLPRGHAEPRAVYVSDVNPGKAPRALGCVPRAGHRRTATPSRSGRPPGGPWRRAASRPTPSRTPCAS